MLSLLPAECSIGPFFVATAVAEAEFAREYRNKRVDHQDHGYAHDPSARPLSGISHERVEAVLKALRTT